MFRDIHIPILDSLRTPKVPETIPFTYTSGEKWRITRPILRALLKNPPTLEQRENALEYARPKQGTREGNNFYRGVTLLEALQLITEGQQTSQAYDNPWTLIAHEYPYAYSRSGIEGGSRLVTAGEDYVNRTGKTREQLIRRFGPLITDILETPLMLEIGHEREKTHYGTFQERGHGEYGWKAQPPITIDDLTPRCIEMFQKSFGIDLNKYRLESKKTI